MKAIVIDMAATARMLVGGSVLALAVFAFGVESSRAQNSPRPRQEIARNECAARAFTSYVTANDSLLQQQGAAPLPSVEMIIAQRRLQEQFCLQFARCQFPDPTNQMFALPYVAAFNSCLRDEAREQK
jgi:hypothetical protein